MKHSPRTNRRSEDRRPQRQPVKKVTLNRTEQEWLEILKRAREVAEMAKNQGRNEWV